MKFTLSALLPCGAVEVSAHYAGSEPYSITLRFPETAEASEWVLGRDLLAEALRTGQSGTGELRVTVRGDLVTLGLSTAAGARWALFRRTDLAVLLALTWRVVAPGCESAHLDWSDIAEFPGVSL